MSNLISNFYYNNWKKRKVKNQLFQTGSNCYIFGCLNALRYHSPILREMPLERVKELIKVIEEKVGKSKSIYKILNVLIELGYVISYKKERSRLVHDLKNLGCAVVSQKRVLGLPKTKVKRWNAIVQRLKDGKGVTGHAVAVKRFSRVFGVMCINNDPILFQYGIKDLDQIRAIYKIVPNERQES